jgi:hypothetical protein
MGFKRKVASFFPPRSISHNPNIHRNLPCISNGSRKVQEHKEKEAFVPTKNSWQVVVGKEIKKGESNEF